MSEIEDKYVFLTPRICIETLVNKRVFYQSLIKNKVSHPTTYFPDNYNEVKEIGQKIEYSVIIKPAITQLFAPRFWSKVLVVRSQEELENYWKLALQYKVVIQEIIPGPPTNVFAITGYFNRNNNPNGSFAYQRKRDWPLGFGCNSLIESIPMGALQMCKETTTRYLKEIGYTDLFEAEFKRDSRDGSF